VRAPHAVLAGLLLVLALGACGEDGAVTDPDATAALERQRADVRLATSRLLHAARAELAASPREPSGTFRGCESAFDQEFRTFRYLSQARVDLAGADDAVEAGRRLLEAAGFAAETEPTVGPGARRTLRGEQGDLAAVIADTGAGRFLLVSVSGPCIEVPEGERGDWLTRDG